MKTFTVNELYKHLSACIKQGLGDKKIMISSDDEGNEYHELFFGITANVKDVFSGEYAPFPPYGVTKDNVDEYVILG